MKTYYAIVSSSGPSLCEICKTKEEAIDSLKTIMSDEFDNIVRDVSNHDAEYCFAEKMITYRCFGNTRSIHWNICPFIIDE